MAERVVVGVDGSSTSRAALRWAAEEARLRGAVLDVVLAWDYPEPHLVHLDDLPPQDELEAAATRTIEEILDDELGDGPRPEVNLVGVRGKPAEVLLDTAEGAQLLVVGSRGMGSVRGMVLGSVSLRCVTRAHVPVVVISDADH